MCVVGIYTLTNNERRKKKRNIVKTIKREEK